MNTTDSVPDADEFVDAGLLGVDNPEWFRHPEDDTIYRVLDVVRGHPNKWYFVAVLATPDGEYAGTFRFFDGDDTFEMVPGAVE